MLRICNICYQSIDDRTKEITAGASPTTKKKRTANAILFVGHLGLETCLVETHRLRCLLSAKPVQTDRTKEITAGASPTTKKRTALAILFVGHLGLETCLVETHRLRCLLSAKPVQTNRTKEITAGASPTTKKRTALAILFVGHLGLEPRTSRL